MLRARSQNTPDGTTLAFLAPDVLRRLGKSSSRSTPAVRPRFPGRPTKVLKSREHRGAAGLRTHARSGGGPRVHRARPHVYHSCLCAAAGQFVLV